LHPHLSGVPHRINYLRDAIDALMARDDTVFLRGSQILEWFLSESAQARTGT
jgi:hypothetical protein